MIILYQREYIFNQCLNSRIKESLEKEYNQIIKSLKISRELSKFVHIILYNYIMYSILNFN